MTEKLTATEIAEMIEKKYPSPAFVFLREVRNGTGFARKEDRTADAIAVSTYPSRGLYLTGFEIKVTKSDWRRELSLPDKAAEIQKYCRHWYVAAPKGIVPIDEVPPTWGIIECQRIAKVVKPSPVTEEQPIDMLLFCSIMRAFNEQRIPARDVAQLVAKAEGLVHEQLEKKESYELQQLKEKIAVFEKESGVSLDDRWLLGDIGKAVRLISITGLAGVVEKAEYMAEEHARISRRLNDAVLELEENDHEPT